MLSFIKKVFSKNEALTKPTVISAPAHPLSRSQLSSHCLIVLDTLKAAGFEVYVVGGSVRDLLLGREPKDFDVATNAKPEQIRHLFKNCRLIGRRFRLAHIYFKHEIIEVATFRKEGKKDRDQLKTRDGLLKRDNVYGTLKDDVWRRDFTLNALYYDAQNNTILDHTNGLYDLQQGIIRVIGKPEVRYREDPVRILRAIRFAAKLGMTLEDNTAQAIAKTHSSLASIAPARLLDESHKLFNSGNAVNTFAALRHYEVLQYLYPLTEQALNHPGFHLFADKFILSALKNTDARVAQNKPINPAFLVAVFLWYPVQILLEQEPSTNRSAYIKLEQAGDKVLRQAKQHLALTQLIMQTVMDIWLLQFKLIGKHRYVIEGLAREPRFRAAYDFLCLRADTEEHLKPIADWWTHWQEANKDFNHDGIEQGPTTPKPRKKRRYFRHNKTPRTTPKE